MFERHLVIRPMPAMPHAAQAAGVARRSLLAAFATVPLACLWPAGALALQAVGKLNLVTKDQGVALRVEVTA